MSNMNLEIRLFIRGQNIRSLHVYGIENVCKIIFVDILCSFFDIFISRMFMNRNDCKFQFV